MKSIITSFIFIFYITFIQAQTNPATPNADFSLWTHNAAGYDDAVSWNDLNSSTNILGIITCYKDSTNYHSAPYSVHLVTMQWTAILIPGAFTTGTINTISYTISGGLPYTLRPDSIIGWYEYSSVSGDNGDCEFYLFGATHADTIGKAFFSTPTSNVTAWTRFSLPITYRSSSTPDTALWIFSSSINQANAKVGSQLFVDDLGLVFDSATGVKNITKNENISVGPNPTNGPISISNNSNSKSLVFTLFDITGRKVESDNITSGTSYLNLAAKQEGVYIYSIQDEQNAVIKTGKIVVQK